MVMDLQSFVRQMQEDGTLDQLANSPRAQFGPRNRQFLGATILPERQVARNSGTEAQIEYRTVIANDGTRYSPVQIKQTGQLVGSFSWELGHQDIGSQLDSVQYDALLELLESNANMDAMATMVGFVDNTIVQPLIEVVEKQRWQALVDAMVVRIGDNGVREEVEYPNPEGHRVTAGGDWWDDSYDPIEDIFAINAMFEDKGMRLRQIITRRQILMALSRNEMVRRRYAGVRVLSDSDLFTPMSAPQLNAGLVADGLPQIETYDLSYNTQDGSRTPFLPAGTMVFLAETGADVDIVDDYPPQQGGEVYRTLEDTLGYAAIGRGAGRPTSGRYVRAESFDNKPPRVECEGWQASLPIIQQPEAVAVISGIEPATP